jgi:Zn-dependent peptidase ImmA (M78 family)/transcriptional regulator with XRE-family HTH domain
LVVLTNEVAMSYESISIANLAERLVAARKMAKVTQEAAADHLNMSRPTFIAIEKAARRPKPEELVKLAALYGLPVSKLLRGDSVPEPLRPHLRSVLESSGGDSNALEDAVGKLTSYIDDYQFIEKIAGSQASLQFPPEVRVPHGSMERFAEHCALEQRLRLGIGELQPVGLLRKILEDAGLHVFFDALDSKLAGLYAFVPAFGYCILVNSRHPRERRRWTIAHEYGHFLADRDRPGVDYEKPMQRKSESERFADLFAAAFLMPEAGVTRRFYEDVNRTGDFKVADLFHMADFFSVSPMAMSLRLEAIGLVPRGSWDQVQESGVPVSTLKREAGVSGASPEDSTERYPERYKLLAVKAFENGDLSEGQLAALLRCSRVEARQIVADTSRTWGESDSERTVSLERSLLKSGVA